MKNKSGKKMSKVLKAFIIAVIIVFIGAAICYMFIGSSYMKTLRIANQLQKQQQAQQQVSADDQKILAQLKKIILLPDDIVPTMAVVTDAELLKKQQPAFFNNVKNGDHVIIYPDMAIVYDYDANKIMKVGPVQTATPAVSASSTKPSAK